MIARSKKLKSKFSLCKQLGIELEIHDTHIHKISITVQNMILSDD